MVSLNGHVAVVTGAAGGMGGGITRRMIQSGAHVICLDKVDPSPRIDELNGMRSNSASGFTIDVRDSAAMSDCIEEVAAKFGRLDIMVNNAGIEQPLMDLVDTDDEVFREVIDVDLFGVFVGMRAAGRVMKGQRRGAIINTSSQLGKVAFESWAVYSAAKAGVIALTQAAARELAPYSVRANAVCPGTFDTPLAHRVMARYAERDGLSTEDIIQNYERDSIGLGRLGRPDEMGSVCAFLASEDASFITGAAINLTGGEQYFF